MKQRDELAFKLDKKMRPALQNNIMKMNLMLMRKGMSFFYFR